MTLHSSYSSLYRDRTVVLLPVLLSVDRRRTVLGVRSFSTLMALSIGRRNRSLPRSVEVLFGRRVCVLLRLVGISPAGGVVNKELHTRRVFIRARVGEGREIPPRVYSCVSQRKHDCRVTNPPLAPCDGLMGVGALNKRLTRSSAAPCLLWPKCRSRPVEGL